jgi:hypothetical protein
MNKKIVLLASLWWLTPVILPIQEAEIRRITVRSQPRQIVWETLSQKNPPQNRNGRVAQVIGHLPSKASKPSKPSKSEALSSNPSTTGKK